MDSQNESRSSGDEGGDGGPKMIRIFIANVAPQTKTEELAEFFSEHGVEVHNTKIIKGRRIAFVEVETEEDCTKVESIEDTMVNGAEMRCERSRDKKTRAEEHKEAAIRTLFIKGFNRETPKDVLMGAFGDKVKGISFPRRSRQAFIEFLSEEDAEAAIEQYQGVEVEGFKISLDYVGKKRKRTVKPKTKTRKQLKEAQIRTIFVSGLNFDTTEETLQETFGDKVTEVRLLRGNMGMSRGRAFVEFEAEEDAEAAIKAHQGIELEGFKLFLDFVGEKRNMVSTNIFISGLSKDASPDDLKEKLGAVAVKLRYYRNQEGEQQPTGKVTCFFSTQEELQKATDELTGEEFEGSEIVFTKKEDQGEIMEIKPNELFIRNLGEESTEEGLQEKFKGSNYVKVVRNRRTNKPKGYGFVRFDSKEDAEKAVEDHHETEYEGSTISVEISKINKRNRDDDILSDETYGIEIYIGNLSEDSTEEALQEKFVGNTNVKMIMDKETEKSKGFAFIRFETKEDAEKAIEDFNETEFDGQTITVQLRRPMRRFNNRRGGYGGRGGYGRGRQQGPEDADKGGRRGGNRRFRRQRRNYRGSKKVDADGDAVATNGVQSNDE